MATATRVRFAAVSRPETLADLVAELGNIPTKRILLRPPLGTATESDVIAALEAPNKRLCELVDGVLVEKAMGFNEALLASIIVQFLWNFLDEHDLGIVAGADGPVGLKLGLVRIPDACFIAWDRLPEGKLPVAAIPSVVPNLAVEVLSKSNTRQEINRKLIEYFQAGVQLVWLVQPRTETAEVFTSPDTKRKVGKDGSLDGGEVLPGFSLSLKRLFTRANRRRGAR